MHACILGTVPWLLKVNSLWDEVGKLNPSEFVLGEEGSPQPQTPPFTIVEVTPPNHG